MSSYIAYFGPKTEGGEGGQHATTTSNMKTVFVFHLDDDSQQILDATVYRLQASEANRSYTRI
jgi:hypothetical protein